ncbi:RNA polymerase sigma factor [Treponema pallidum]|nr:MULTISPECIES: RNA polymerase sigma factor [Treponema]AEH40048.1 DNA-directed RNA polymerase sigma subunit RpoE [Treponema paraluiscuniculi Cuniculi A]AEZ57211.1 DNA-directed RNA polymerase sigma subunit RpoE [Treponema pallidum subsp. pertenue str. SamoaD]AEZ59347.1 DNA-directed RNA polymerase sigma subunit RpoE [Treponema pallidum subsp. pertenue str. Gauthier]AEZ60412.1 DNA-directed RNA polymerase sigma subunit RpoE [Treponema pallidum subsp. pallidum DAL-1]AGK83735.1 DNA-directed RNA pol
MLHEQELLRAQDDADFKLMYEQLVPVLYRVAYNVVREEDIAEGLCHDAFIAMTEKRMEFPSLSDAKYWLIRVVKNASLNYAKRRVRERHSCEQASREHVCEPDTGELRLLRIETIEQVRAALDRLPEHLRVVLQLREYGDLNYKEIGRILGISEGNVKVRVFRARERLAKYLGETDAYLS